jgi:clathrin heavy chain
LRKIHHHHHHLICATLTCSQTLESDAFVCVRQKLSDDAQPEVIIVNLKNGNEVLRRPIKADSAIMHWHKQVIALKAQQRTLQIFDLAAKTKLKSATMAEDVLFWKWISIDTLGLVTETSVFHWNVFESGTQQPIKVFERNANLNVSLWIPACGPTTHLF